MTETRTLHFDNARQLQSLYANDLQLLKRMEDSLGVKVTTREGWVKNPSTRLRVAESNNSSLRARSNGSGEAARIFVVPLFFFIKVGALESRKASGFSGGALQKQGCSTSPLLTVSFHCPTASALGQCPVTLTSQTERLGTISRRQTALRGHTKRRVSCARDACALRWEGAFRFWRERCEQNGCPRGRWVC